MAIPEVSSPREVRNHWWWRPGWREGRHFYACHFTLEDQPALRNLVRHYQEPLAGLPALDLIPARWLHLTMQGIGFVDEVSASDLAGVTERLREELARFPAPTVAFQSPTIRSEAVLLVAEPQEPLYRLRLTMYDAIAASLPPAKFSQPRPKATSFTPHVSLAYINSDTPAEPIAHALRGVTQPEAVTVTFRAASLLVFHRDRRMYEWTHATPLPLRPGKS